MQNELYGSPKSISEIGPSWIVRSWRRFPAWQKLLLQFVSVSETGAFLPFIDQNVISVSSAI
ncbi:MAG: hypothetical protein PUJ39_13015 [Eubacteriales bacterium]|nr:hypothetical protein [Eubacteriales bacterium]